MLQVLVDSQDLLISPDGILARLPFSAVIQPSGEFLEDRYRISYLSSGRDVAIWDKPHQRKRSAIIFADPNYDSVLPKPNVEENDFTRSRPSRRKSWRAPPMAGVRLDRLPGSLLEAEGIARLLEERSSLDVLLFTDLNASEDAMAFVESPWLMQNFYARWLAGESKAEALRQARAFLRKKYPPVAIWAPFVLVGDPS